MSLAGKVIAITGGASGIGLATTKLLAQRGAIVAVADIDAAALDRVKAHLVEKQRADATPSASPTFSVTSVDVSKRDQVDAWITGVVAQFGRLDGAANIAGIIGPSHAKGSLAELEDDEWDRLVAVNLSGCMYCLRAELRVIQDGGSIVNMASIHGTSAQPYHAAYGATKHGVIGLTKAAAKENGAREVRVNAVAPGSIYTPLMVKSYEQLGLPADAKVDDLAAYKRQGTAEEVAGVVAFLLGPESTFISGSVYAVDGAWA